jgi:hypothetical protein
MPKPAPESPSPLVEALTESIIESVRQFAHARKLSRASNSSALMNRGARVHISAVADFPVDHTVAAKGAKDAVARFSAKNIPAGIPVFKEGSGSLVRVKEEVQQISVVEQAETDAAGALMQDRDGAHSGSALSLDKLRAFAEDASHKETAVAPHTHRRSAGVLDPCRAVLSTSAVGAVMHGGGGGVHTHAEDLPAHWGRRWRPGRAAAVHPSQVQGPGVRLGPRPRAHQLCGVRQHAARLRRGHGEALAGGGVAAISKLPYVLQTKGGLLCLRPAPQRGLLRRHYRRSHTRLHGGARDRCIVPPDPKADLTAQWISLRVELGRDCDAERMENSFASAVVITGLRCSTCHGRDRPAPRTAVMLVQLEAYNAQQELRDTWVAAQQASGASASENAFVASIHPAKRLQRPRSQFASRCASAVAKAQNEIICPVLKPRARN